MQVKQIVNMKRNKEIVVVLDDGNKIYYPYGFFENMGGITK